PRPASPHDQPAPPTPGPRRPTASPQPPRPAGLLQAIDKQLSMASLITCLFALWFFAPVALNVQDYGATGNGATDDTNAINRALAAAHAQGKPLWFPPGTYECDQHDGSGNILTFDAGGTNNSALYGKDATILTRDTGSAAIDSKLLYIYAFAPSQGLTIQGLKFTSTHPRTNRYTVGIFITGTGGTELHNISFRDCVFSGFGIDVQGQGIRGWSLESDSFYAPNGHDDACSGSNSSHPAVNCWFADNSNGACYDVDIEHCWASGYTGPYPMKTRRPMDGFIYGTGYGFRIIGNHTENFGEEHIFLMPPKTDPATTATILIDSNTIDGSLPAGSTDDDNKPHNYDYGIRVDASHARISNNKIMNCAWGIMHRSMDYPDFSARDLKLSNNHISAPKDAGTVLFRGAIYIK
ncbi:MAG TPA: glycosyl hydrolase family 28-related protein, partial [Puia sp.]|nr:glycosyl hydrolase family 28-related protein [Puia sp.]